MLKKLLVILATILTVASASARPTVHMVVPGRVDFAAPDGAALGADRIKQAIANAGRKHGWVVKAERAGVLTLEYSKERGKHEVVVDVSYDDKGYQIVYVSSVGMMYRQQDDDTRIHPYYNKWIAALDADIEAAVRRGP